MIRLHVRDTLAEGQGLVLSDAQGRYLVQVMRRAAGDEVLVFNGRDGEWLARIAEAGKRSTRLELVRQTRAQPPAGALVLVMALVKRTPLETAVAKAVELGVAEIRLAITERSNADHTRIFWQCVGSASHSKSGATSSSSSSRHHSTARRWA
jgi:16S rRNA (uracil1498-N3)-methyltransferase